ncbi:MAG: SprB repeat-containing protein, partial [Bacteroidota bacterium]
MRGIILVAMLFTAMVLKGQPLTITSVTSTPVSCYGGSDGTLTINISGGQSPYTYILFTSIISPPIEVSLPTAATSYTFTGHTARNYLVAVRDNIGNEQATYYAITGPAPVTITSAVVTDITCNGAGNGSITVTATGEDNNLKYDLTGPVNITNGTGIFSGLPGGDYTVTVSSYNGCPSNDVESPLTITDPNTVSISVDNITDVGCFEGSDGTISITPSGGTPSGVGTGYTYAWTGPNGFTSTSEDLTGLETGNYSVTVADVNGCSSNAGPLFVDQAPEIAVVLTGSSDISCPGGNDGTASITPSGGTPGYTYLWSGQGTGFTSASKDPVNLVADTYDLTITDSNGCSKTFTSIVTLTEPAVITATVNTVNDVSCPGGNDGSVLITAGGGTPGYTFAWTGNTSGYSSAAEDPVNMPADTYDLTITDSQGCPAFFNDLTTVSEPPVISVTLDGSSDVSCNGGNDGSAQITLAGGTPGYTYLWTGDVTAFTSTAQDPSNLIADTYDLTITDSNG